MGTNSLKHFLEEKYLQYNRPEFIQDDPISIPHQYTKKQDIEITGFWTAMLAWGQRKTIISKARELFSMMDYDPYNFILYHKEQDLKPFTLFKHRTFNATDTLYFIHFFKKFYRRYDSLEQAFTEHSNANMETMLRRFHDLFFDDPDHPARTRKHIATPARNSACKRMNMFLRWMVRKDDMGVDFGLWDNIKPEYLICPCDLHVGRVARKLGLISRTQNDWKTAQELTGHLRKFDPHDPVKYDFALFGLGIVEKF